MASMLLDVWLEVAQRQVVDNAIAEAPSLIVTIAFILWLCVDTISQEMYVYTGSLCVDRAGLSKVFRV